MINLNFQVWKSSL